MSLGQPGQLFASVFGHRGDQPGRLRRDRCLLSLILSLILPAGMALVLPVAAASLADPLWIPGMYDGGDFDDLVALAGDMNVPPSPQIDLRLAGSAPGLATPADVAVMTAMDHVNVYMRAPPADESEPRRLASVIY
jgi:hypothetical protein